MMKYGIGVLLLFTAAAFAQSGSKVIVGTPSSIINEIAGMKSTSLSEYTFTTCSGERIKASLDFFHFEDGWLSLSGSVQGTENAPCILKGDAENIYGWVVMKNDDKAFEYTTDRLGNVVVQQVPVTKIFPVCDFNELREPHFSELMHFPTIQSLEDTVFTNVHTTVPHIGNYPTGTDVMKLQSFPGSKQLLYIDVTAIASLPKEDIWILWQCVASQFSFLTINVTTDANLAKEAGQANTGKARIINADGRSSSPVGAFGTSQYSSVYLTQKPHNANRYSTGMTCAHELGHLIGLDHDRGQPGGEYYEGQAEFKWIPLMGNTWFVDDQDPNPIDPSKPHFGVNAVCQHSKGEYSSASNKQDDIAITIKNCRVKYRDEDITGMRPVKFVEKTRIVPDSNYGQICPSTDLDTFSFQITADKGHVKLKIDRIEYKGLCMLDVDAAIVDESGKEVARDNPKAARYAAFDMDLNKGKYLLVIQGGAEGTPQKGFSKYSSMGFYAMAGEITGGGTGITHGVLTRSCSRPIVAIDNRGTITLASPDNGTVKDVSVFSMNGVRLFHSDDRVSPIDLSRAAAGIYMVQATINGAVFTQRIVKK